MIKRKELVNAICAKVGVVREKNIGDLSKKELMAVLSALSILGTPNARRKA